MRHVANTKAETSCAFPAATLFPTGPAWPTFRGEVEALDGEEFVTNKGDEREAGSAPLTSPDPPRCPARRAPSCLPTAGPALHQSTSSFPPDRRHQSTTLNTRPSAVVLPRRAQSEAKCSQFSL